MQTILNLAKWPKKFLALLFPTDASGLGTVSGVYIPSVLMMFGVILYLRLGWITGNVGPSSMIMIISLALAIMIITSLSMTSIVSNMKVGGGGAYYMISRSLGIELGSAIGIALYLCQCVSASLCVSGFAESIHNLLPNVSVQTIEMISLSVLALISIISTNLALTTQFLIFIILGVSLCSIFSGSGAHLTEPNSIVLPTLGFWGAFAMFYPAMTGVEVGMAMSGTLKNPSRSLPIGIIASLLTVFVLYLGLSLFLSSQATPEQLRSDTFIVYKIASIPQLILWGIWGATLSSSLSCLIGAPRMVQAIAEDGVLPKILAKTFGKKSEPRLAIALTFVLALCINLTTTINQVIPLGAMICLISYGSLNFVVYFEEILKNPSWRPAFKIRWPLPLIGGLACFAAMWMINPLMSLICCVIVIGIYIWVARKNLHSDWQDMRYSLLFFLYRKAVYTLATTPVDSRNWRPNILTLAASPLSRENLIHFSHSLTQGKGYLVFASIIPDYFHDDFPLDASKKVFEDFLKQKKIPSLVEVCTLKKGYEGVRDLIHAYSFGALLPNTVILPSPEEGASLKEFAKTVMEGYQLQKNMLVLRDNGEASTSIFCEKNRTPRTIDIWWEGHNRLNLDLIFSLYSVLKHDRIWKNSRATVKMIVDSELAKENLETYFDNFLTNNRIEIDVKIYIEEQVSDPFEKIAAYSRDTDLVVLGLPSPETLSSVDEFSTYYQGLEKKTASLKNTLFVLHGENLNLREMWQFGAEE